MEQIKVNFEDYEELRKFVIIRSHTLHRRVKRYEVCMLIFEMGNTVLTKQMYDNIQKLWKENEID